MKIAISLAGICVCVLAVAGIIWNERAIKPRQRDGTDYYRARGMIGMVLGVALILGGSMIFGWGMSLD